MLYYKRGIMKVLQINVNGKNSSTGDIVYAIHNKLLSLNHKSLLCYGRGPNFKEKGMYKFGIDIETYIHAMLTRFIGLTNCFSPISTLLLLRQIKKFDPDIVHISEANSYFLNHKMLIKHLKKRNCKILWSMHCDIMYTGKCGLAVDCQRYKIGCGKCPRLREYPKTLFFDFTAHMFKKKKRLLSNLDFKLSFPSRWLEDRFKQSFLKDKTSYIIPNGIDCKDFYPHIGARERLCQDLNLDKNKHILLAVMPSINDENKGFNRLVNLLNTLDDSFYLLVLSRDSLKDRANIDSRIVFLQASEDKQKLAHYYSAADAFILCSRLETFSLTVAESLSCGTPVCGYCCGAPETIFINEYASFVPFENVNALREALLAMLAKNVDKNKLHNYVKENFSKDSMLNKYLQLYKEL